MMSLMPQHSTHAPNSQRPALRDAMRGAFGYERWGSVGHRLGGLERDHTDAADGNEAGNLTVLDGFAHLEQQHLLLRLTEALTAPQLLRHRLGRGTATVGALLREHFTDGLPHLRRRAICTVLRGKLTETTLVLLQTLGL